MGSTLAVVMLVHDGALTSRMKWLVALVSRTEELEMFGGEETVALSSPLFREGNGSCCRSYDWLEWRESDGLCSGDCSRRCCTRDENTPYHNAIWDQIVPFHIHRAKPVLALCNCNMGPIYAIWDALTAKITWLFCQLAFRFLCTRGYIFKKTCEKQQIRSRSGAQQQELPCHNARRGHAHVSFST